MNKPLLSLALTLSCTAAWAAEGPQLPASVAACGSIQDAQQRGACYDREIAALNKTPPKAAAPAPATAAAPAQPSDATSRAVAPPPSTGKPAPSTASKVMAPFTAAVTFGQELISKKVRPPQDAADQFMHATITSVREPIPGEFRFVLDNGQTWSQQEPKLGFFLKQGDGVTIGRGALSAYRLWRDEDGGKAWVPVTRIR